MKIFVDTADLEEIKEAFSYGVVDGVTTNPSLMKKALGKPNFKGFSLKQYVSTILEVAGNAPVSLEVKGFSADEMYVQGKTLYELFKKPENNILIKVPLNPTMGTGEPMHFEGLKAIKRLSSEGIPINTTLIFTPEQALLAAKAGAKVVSPFAGRIDDKLREQEKVGFGKEDYYPSRGFVSNSKLLDDNGIVSGIDLVGQIVTIFKNYGIETEVLAASIRNARQAREAALVGAQISTLPLSILKDMVRHPKSIEGMAKFIEDIVPDYELLWANK